MGKEVTVRLKTDAEFILILNEQEANAIVMVMNKPVDVFLDMCKTNFGIGNKEGWRQLYEKTGEVKKLIEEVEQARDTIRANKIAQVLLQ